MDHPGSVRRETDESTLSIADLEAQVAAASTRTLELRSTALSLRAQKAVSTLSLPLPLPFSSLPPSPSPFTSPSASQVSTIPDAGRDEGPLTPSLDARILTFALSRTKAATTHMLSNLYRMQGVTSFSAKELSGEKLLGVRIDAQSRRDAVFRKPVYVLLEHRAVEKGAEKVWIVARHSAPAWIGVAELAGRFLPSGKGRGRQRVEGFVRGVRDRVVRWVRRVDAVEGVKEASGDAEVEWDREVAVVVVKWADGTEGRCRVDEEGKVTRVVVTGKTGRRIVEREIAMKGSLEGLPARLGWGVEE